MLYIGVTKNLIKRVEEHKNEINEGFTKKYQTKNLVYYEYFTDIRQAIHREKELKGWSRKKKITLIQDKNPTWKDLYSDITQ